MSTSADRSTSDSKLNSLKLSNWILATSVVVALVSILFGLRQNRRLGLEKRQLQFQLERLAKIAPCDSPRIGDIVPPIEANNAEGERVTIDYSTTSRYLFFFLSFKCNECVKEVPQWNEIAKTAKGKNVVVFGLATDKEDAPVNYPARGFDVLTIKDAALLRAYRINLTPTVMLISERGRTQWVRTGSLSEAGTRDLLSIISGNTVISN